MIESIIAITIIIVAIAVPIYIIKKRDRSEELTDEPINPPSVFPLPKFTTDMFGRNKDD